MTRSEREGWSRRRFLRALGGGALVAGAGIAPAGSVAGPALRKVIPSSGEALPAIGMGTWITFNVGRDADLRAGRTEVLRTFLQLGGGMVDSSPMYGSAEEVVGHALGRIGDDAGLFSATKVWTRSARGGVGQMAESRKLWGLDRLDLMQVHNLLSWKEHLDTIRRERDEGLVRYTGVTTSHGRRHDELEQIMRSEPIDFVQLTYNILDREAERRLLPLAADRGIAVIANRPFRQKALITRFERHPLPDWAEEIQCENWAQFLLKFIVSHPAVTCAIPATSRVEHMRQNMGALHGPQPDAVMRGRMIDYVEKL
jgi:diketogulonate reductase-like aldo/keto reductase